MSLRNAKTLYCVVMMSVALLLAAWGGLLGCAAGALLLTGALPLFKVAIRAAAELESSGRAIVRDELIRIGSGDASRRITTIHIPDENK